VSTFKPKRIGGAELARVIAPAVANLPPAAVPLPSPELRAHKRERTEQINFRASPQMAQLVARLAVEHGSVRRLFARLLRDAGHDVPESDLAPPPGRRRVGTS
jgi:hypothetical protein